MKQTDSNGFRSIYLCLTRLIQNLIWGRIFESIPLKAGSHVCSSTSDLKPVEVIHSCCHLGHLSTLAPLFCSLGVCWPMRSSGSGMTRADGQYGNYCCSLFDLFILIDSWGEEEQGICSGSKNDGVLMFSPSG